MYLSDQVNELNIKDLKGVSSLSCLSQKLPRSASLMTASLARSFLDGFFRRRPNITSAHLSDTLKTGKPISFRNKQLYSLV